MSRLLRVLTLLLVSKTPSLKIFEGFLYSNETVSVYIRLSTETPHLTTIFLILMYIFLRYTIFRDIIYLQ